ncbi:hypothetical protein [Jannaschia sp. CCS1]|uniref:hypothetical protein n=1 Tax=Jannaschia sp. (strain CCS1) TaxID=290400 RepID=UPI0002E081F8|nr:hypothetical protein [Jannaschia sp. CCS1]
MSFTAIIREAFVLSDGKIVLDMSEIEGMPTVGDLVRAGGGAGRIVELGRNSTDGQVVSTRACLTGKEVAPYGGIVVVWRAQPTQALGLQRIEGTADV